MTSPYASFVNVLKACESAGGAGSKADIKAALSTLNEFGQELFKYAMDPFLVFGIKKFDRLPQHEYSSTDNGNVNLITNVLDKLAAGELTGNAARTAWATSLAEQTFETAKYLERIVAKDLNAGFSDETFNKVHKNNPVRVFNVMLADKCTTEEEFEELTFPSIADIKYDGLRRAAFVGTSAIMGNPRRFRITQEDGTVISVSENDMAELTDGSLIPIKSLTVGADVLKYHHTLGENDGNLDEETTRP